MEYIQRGLLKYLLFGIHWYPMQNIEYQILLDEQSSIIAIRSEFSVKYLWLVETTKLVEIS